MFKCRRIFVLFVVLIFLMAVPLTAFASSPYIGIDKFHNASLVFDYRLPLATYEVSFSYNDTLYVVPGLVLSSYDSNIYVDVPFEFEGDLGLLKFTVWFDREEPYTYMQMLFDNGSSSRLIEVPSVSLVVPADSISDVSLASVVDSGVVSIILVETLSILGLCFSTFVGFVSIRKAISWLISVLRSA